MVYVELRTQGRFVQVKKPFLYKKRKTPAGHRRGRITVFSAAARKRMLDTTAKLRADVPCRFVTLTYSDCIIPWRGMEAKAHLRALFERMRRAAPDASAVWRMELKPRKSGDHVGVVVPHFHLLVFNADILKMPDETNRHYSGWFHEAWESITKHHAWYPSDGRHDLRTDDVEIVNQRQMMYYVSKYAAKNDGGRTTLVTNSYSHVGRLWGIHNRAKIPFCPLQEISVYASENAFKAFQATSEAEYPAIAQYNPRRGFTLYVDCAADWHEFLLWLIGVYPRNLNSGSLCYNDVRKVTSIQRE